MARGGAIRPKTASMTGGGQPCRGGSSTTRSTGRRARPGTASSTRAAIRRTASSGSRFTARLRAASCIA